MNEAGVLGRFVPDFGRVVSMMQFNMYHHFTVDEHLIRTIGVLSDIERGEAADSHPLSTRIINTVQHRRALYVAAFLHDIAKGRDEDHSIVGARIARSLGPRLGLTAAETETAAWLIEQHLTMSQVAFSRDIGDPKTVRDFANIVQSPERLKLLLVLTVADIRAVGPGIWNGWKGQLLRALYYEAEPVVAGGHTQLGSKARVETAQERFRTSLSDWSATDVQRFIDRYYPDYWLRTDTRKAVEQAKMVRAAERAGIKVRQPFLDGRLHGHHRAFRFCAEPPPAVGSFRRRLRCGRRQYLGSAHFDDPGRLRARHVPARTRVRSRRGRVAPGATDCRVHREASEGRGKLSNLMANRHTRRSSRIGAFTVAPEVLVDNTLSNQFTVVEVSGLDRPGLLYELTNTLSDLNLDITSAHITTFGEKAVDVFYVTDLTNKQIASPQRQKAIKARLMSVLAARRAPTMQ